MADLLDLPVAVCLDADEHGEDEDEETRPGPEAEILRARPGAKHYDDRQGEQRESHIDRFDVGSRRGFQRPSAIRAAGGVDGDILAAVRTFLYRRLKRRTAMRTACRPRGDFPPAIGARLHHTGGRLHHIFLIFHFFISVDCIFKGGRAAEKLPFQTDNLSRAPERLTI